MKMRDLKLRYREMEDQRPEDGYFNQQVVTNPIGPP